MTEKLDATTLFLDSSNIRPFTASTVEAAYPFIDFEFEEGDLRSEARLTLNVDDGSWHGIIRTAEDAESDFDEGVDASPEQIEALKAKLPENANDLIEKFKGDFGPKPGM